MNHATLKLTERPGLSLLDEPPHELSRAMLASRFPVVMQLRRPWRCRSRRQLCDLLAVDAELRTWHVAAVEPAERLSVLLHLMSDRKLARHVRDGDRVQLHCWSRRSGGLMVEVVELAAEDFTCRR